MSDSDLKESNSPTEEKPMETENNDEKPEPKIESPPPSEPNTPSKSPEDEKKSKVNDRKKDNEVQSDEDEEEDEELPLGLLERPVIIESGKRERKKTDRLPATIDFTPTQKKKVEIPEGRGTKLRDCPRVEHKLQHTKAEDLKHLHKLLYSKQGTANETKKNIRLFCGFAFESGDKEYERRLTVIQKLTMSQLKFICDVLDLEKGGQKNDVISRIMTFLLNPVESGKPLPKPKHKRTSSGKKNKGEKRKRSKKKESKKKSKEELSDDDDDDEDDDDEQKDAKDDEDDEDVDQAEESEEEEIEPPKKKKKTETPKKAKAKPTKEKKAKENGKKEKTPSKKKSKKMEEVADDDEEESSDDEPLSKKSTDPPDNNELKKVVEKILDGADLEQVTMKTVVKQVYAKYPTFDLSDKKDFIKSTVKEIIS